MGKKKGKRAEQPARDVCEDEPTPEDEEVVDQLEVMAVTGPADEQTEAESDLADLDNSAEGAPSMVVKGNETTRNLVVPYCPICTAPFEFCEWGPEFARCKARFQEHYQQSFPDVSGEEELLELMTRLGFEGETDAAAKKAQKAKKAPSEDAPPPPPSKKDKKKEAAAIVIELNTRNKKKFVTCVRGLELFEVDAPAAAKVFGKKFACGSAFQKGKNGLPDQIEIQGNYKDELPEFIASKFGLKGEAIFFLEGGKKTPAGDAPAS
eukprot:CAMPEP_0181197468 /NCGR_PEP_ID=MMETSP1096-20121128/16060_1 /TAXON_ID=156174 ORGANISM="Chrysochromulina ericina, Strain CCMP281" /NCGR_SAMPLE_ID=MMETSP1096 /ASSEMBLY_ACC=CAM_ASM_000453 /LENGTH=264 /DNA_ID=CAMNT_0023287387 /DNA_START=73 /DNA_END=867 /DNA_ORIENTATION=-